MTTLLDGRGCPVRLGRELGRGGEGAVFVVAGRDDTVAKLYHSPVDQQRTDKLAAMVASGDERLRRLAAWPLDCLYDGRSRQLAGFVMPKVADQKAIHLLYGPKSRLAEFPAAGWPFLIQTASNLARAFAAIHQYGHVIGDVNHGNVLVSERATVTLIDCDSFQIAGGSRTFLCEVGVATHQPPELQGVTFRGLRRTPNHDNFGLAVLIFQLLFMARHPFSGRYLGSGEMPLERAIHEGRFAYGALAAKRQMHPPPGGLPLDAVSDALARLFERAFAANSTRATCRPDGAAWTKALDGLAGQLAQCGRNAAHEYLQRLPACPWCEVEAQTGTALFHAKIRPASPSRGGFDLAAAWARIAATAGPGAPSPLPQPDRYWLRPEAGARRLGYLRRGRIGAGIVLATLGALAALTLLPGFTAVGVAVAAVAAGVALARLGAEAHRQRAGRQVAALRRRWRAFERRWLDEASERRFTIELATLARLRDEHRELPARGRRILDELRSDPRRLQLQRFLEGYRLDAAQISGLGETRRTVLQSYGIETAADLTEAAIRSAPGFGPGLTRALLAWRHGLERRFVFDPARGLDGRDVAAAEQRIDERRREIERLLRGGPAALGARARQITASRAALDPEAKRLARALAQAEANYRAM